jgi:hypothetical protein
MASRQNRCREEASSTQTGTEATADEMNAMITADETEIVFSDDGELRCVE